MFLSIEYFSQLFDGYVTTCYFGNSLIGLDNRFISVFIHLSPKIVQEGFIDDCPLVIILLQQKVYFKFGEVDFPALQSPLEVVLV